MSSNGIKFESKEAVMAFYGVTLAGGELDYTACSNMAAFTAAFITACTAEIEAKRPAIMAEAEAKRQYVAEMVAGVARVGWGADPSVNRVSVTLADDGGLESSGIIDWYAITYDGGAEFAEWLESADDGETFCWRAPG